jgi:uncharacterized protein YbgA (DUF1722 family)/uncharacterized protein YbbK (DUF523 family)
VFVKNILRFRPPVKIIIAAFLFLCYHVTMEHNIRLGISSCLLGELVRYDGGHKLDHFLAEILGGFVEYVPVCPEFEAGFGVPREAMRLVGDTADPRLVTQKGGIDHTERMKRWIGTKLRELEKAELRGFIFKSGSPSSGMERVKVYDAQGNSRKTGAGLFAKAFMERFPLVPVEDEGRLHDIDLRGNFIVRVFAFNRWREQCAMDARPAAIMGFHARHKYLLMAHSPALQKEMGKLVARVSEMRSGEFRESYESLFMKALRHQATVKKNCNVLAHMAGYFRKRLDSDERKELADVIEQYRKEMIPLIVPVTLISHYVRKYREEYLASQYYLYPHPMELKLRNHA